MRKASKKSVIAGVLAFSMILTGTGYAYWTDTLNVTTKATTGDLDVTFADLALYAQYADEKEADGWSIVDGIGDKGYVEDDFFTSGTSYNKIAKDVTIKEYQEKTAKGYNNVDFNAELVGATAIKKSVGHEYTTANTNGSDNVLLTVNQMYPGYAQAFRTDILNVGEMAAKLSNINFKVSGISDKKLTNETKAMLGIALMVDKEAYVYDKNENNKSVFKLCSTLGKDNTFRVGGVDFLRLSALENLTQAEIAAVLDSANLLCSPDSDNRMDLFIAVAMDPDADGKYTTGSADAANPNKKNDNNSQNAGAQVSIDFVWDQFNVNKTIDKGNILIHQNASSVD